MHTRHLILALALSASATRAVQAQISTNPVDEFVSRRAGGGSPRRGCGTPHVPRTLPGAAELTDGGFQAALADFSGRHPASGDSVPYGLYSLTVGSSGEVQSFRPISYWLPASQTEAFGALVRQHLRPAGVSPTTFRVRVLMGTAPSLVAEYSERCPAELRTSFSLRNQDPANPRAPYTLHVHARVAADGRVLLAEVTRSSGDVEIDSWVQGVLMASHAVPALVDGEPVESDAEQELRIRIN